MFLVLILLAFVPVVTHFQGCKSEQVEGLNIYLGVLSNHGKIFLEGRNLRRGWALHPCAQRCARGRADSHGLKRRGGEEGGPSCFRAARAPWSPSVGPRGAGGVATALGAALRHGRKARGRGQRGRSCSFPACDRLRGRPSARARPGGRLLLGLSRSRLTRQTASGGLGQGRGGRGSRKTFFQGEGLFGPGAELPGPGDGGSCGGAGRRRRSARWRGRRR